MNAVIIAIVVMLALSLLRVNVVLALVAGAIVGGFTGGLSFDETIVSFTGGLGAGATIALSYALLGGFAVAISKTGIPQLLVAAMLRIVKKEGEPDRRTWKSTDCINASSDGFILAKPYSDPYCIYTVISTTDFTCLKYVENRSSFNCICSDIRINSTLYFTSIWIWIHLP